MKTCVRLWAYMAEYLLGGEMFPKKKIVGRIEAHVLSSVTFFLLRKSCLLWDNVEKYGTVGEGSRGESDTALGTCDLHAA